LSVLLFLLLFFSPAIGKNLRSEKGIFFFCSEFFSYRANIKNQNDKATEKEDRHKPGKLPFSCLPGVCDYLFFTGRRLNHEGWQMHEKVRK
jgi:hypothetical protein